MSDKARQQWEKDYESESDYIAVLSPPPPLEKSPRTTRVVGEEQQERLRTYLDDELVKITRKYIHRFNDETTSKYTSFSQLLADLDKVIELIWYSINSTVDSNGKKLSFAYSQYLIRIADDLVDFIEGYASEPSPQETIRILQKLDSMLSELIDNKVLFRTETIRLESIAERTRVEITKAFQSVQGYKHELGKVYEGVLDRTA